ncbi:MAG: VTT domain-containing protein [Candidatus Aenigmatarchaeota archaeon]
MVDLALLSDQFFAWAVSLADTWGYLGIFVVSFVGSASIFLPIPAFLVTFTFGALFNPWIIGLISGIGSALGELTGYVLGRGGGKALKEKQEKLLKKSHLWTEKHGLFPVILLFALTPLPDDIIGIIAGAMKYNIKYFLIATFIGKWILYTAIAFAGFYGINTVLGIFSV